MTDINTLVSSLNLDPQTIATLLVLVVWTMIWKGLALWKASQKGEKAWFVILLVLNTTGILEMIYYFWLNRYSLKKKV